MGILLKGSFESYMGSYTGIGIGLRVGGLFSSVGYLR